MSCACVYARERVHAPDGAKGLKRNGEVCLRDTLRKASYVYHARGLGILGGACVEWCVECVLSECVRCVCVCE